MMTKKLLRRELLERREFLYNRSKKAFLDKLVLKRFTDLIEELSPGSVGLYKNFGSEFDTTLLDIFLRENAITVCYPKIINEKMIFAKSLTIDNFAKTKNGFMEPVESDILVPDLVVTPAIAVDRELYRLGYGKGYYDKYIAKEQNSKYITIISDQLVLDKLPRDKWDQPVDKIIEVRI